MLSLQSQCGHTMCPAVNKETTRLIESNTSHNCGQTPSSVMNPHYQHMRHQPIGTLITRINGVEGSMYGALSGSWGDYSQQIAAGQILAKKLRSHGISHHQLNRLTYMLFVNLNSSSENNRVPFHLQQAHTQMLDELNQAFAGLVEKGKIKRDALLELHHHFELAPVINEAVQSRLCKIIHRISTSELDRLSRETSGTRLSSCAETQLDKRLHRGRLFKRISDETLAHIAIDHPKASCKTQAANQLNRRFDSRRFRVQDNVVLTLSEARNNPILTQKAKNTLIKRMHKDRYHNRTVLNLSRNHPDSDIQQIAQSYLRQN